MTTATERVEPKVDDGATFSIGSDSYACTVIAVERNGKTVVLQEDKTKLLNGVNSGEPDALTFSPGGFCGHTSGTQRWNYERNPEGTIHRVSKRVLKTGKVVWKTIGHPTRSPGFNAYMGRRSHHYDFNF